jgi:tol-pal system protein YbgF
MVVLATAAGCASPMSQLRDDNHKLTLTVADLRADKREDQRKIEDLEHQLDELRAKVVSSTFDGSMPPQLPVEVMPAPRGGGAAVPTAQRVVAIADDGTEIIYEGDAAAGKPAVIDPDPDAEPTPAEARHRAEPAPVAEPSSPPREAQRAPVAARRAHAHVEHEQVVTDDAPANDYRAAVELIKAGKHEDAIAALRGFIAKYPRHNYASNAQYWLGEAYYAQHDYQRALVEFRATIETYPRGNKVPDALLKVGYCYSALGQTDRAKSVLEQVVNLYPKSEPAALAAKRLEANP